MLPVPEAGTLIYAHNIVVPETLASAAYYNADLSIHFRDGDVALNTDVGVEPEHRSAVGQEVKRMLVLVLPSSIPVASLDGAIVNLRVTPAKLDHSAVFSQFKAAADFWATSFKV